MDIFHDDVPTACVLNKRWKYHLEIYTSYGETVNPVVSFY